MSKGTRRQSTRTNSGLSNSYYGSASISREKSARGDKVYYRLLTYDAPYNSSYLIDAEDDSLSFIHAGRIPPPGLAADYIHHICTREGIHHTRARLYTSPSVRRSVYSHPHPQYPYGRKTLPDDPSFVLAAPDEPLRLRPSSGCGSSRENPLVLYLDLDPSMDRTQAALPISKLEREGRRVAKIVQRLVDAVESFFYVCFGSLQKIPKGME